MNHSCAAVVTTFAAIAFAWPGISAAQKVPADGYLCCNLRVSGTWASDYNDPRSGGRVLPVGSKVIGLAFGSTQVDVEIEGTKISIGNDYSRVFPIEQFAARWIVPKDPAAELRGLSPKMQQAIKGARLMKGMDRKHVLMAVGWPTASNTPNTEDPIWTYPAANGYTYKVVFDERWRVKAIDADEATKRVVMMP